MKRDLTMLALMALAMTTAGCGSPKPITEAEAATIADETQNAWTSRNVPAVESRYAKTVVGFDPADAAMSSTWEKWDKLQKQYVGNQFDSISVPERRVQVLDADTFVVSGIGTLKVMANPKSAVTMRFTDVYQRQDGGDFVIVNEHVSIQPADGKKS